MENARHADQFKDPSAALRQRAFEKVLQERLDADIQIVQQVALDEAERSGLYSVLKSEIVSFLDYFLEANSWKRLYVTSRLNCLHEDFEDCTHDERRIKMMEFASQMSQLVRTTFREGSSDYRQAMTGLGRIIELLFSWQAERNSPDFPKYRGAKVDGDPVEFLHKNYARWIATGRLSQITLRDSDEKLLNSIKYEMRKSGRSLADLVPPGIRR
ncbi:MAG: hypothetical protein WBO29_05325 [Albidovulum sp.]